MGVQVFDALDLVARVRAADEAFASEDEQGDARFDVVRRGAAKPLDERTCVAAAERTQLAGEDHELAGEGRDRAVGRHGGMRLTCGREARAWRDFQDEGEYRRCQPPADGHAQQ